MKISRRKPYGERRKAEYPPMGDQLDAMMKLAKSLAEQGISLPDDVHDWVARCEAVKRKFPKPE